MKNRLEEQMKEVAENADLRDIMPDFDKEALWKAVAAELPQNRKKTWRIPVVRLSYAAALILLIMGAWYTLSVKGEQTSGSETVQIKTGTPSTAPKSSKNDHTQVMMQTATSAPAHEQQIAVTAEKAIPPVQQQPPHRTITQPDIRKEIARTELPGQEPVITPVPPTANNTPVVIAAAQSKKKVTHYLDIDGEADDTNPESPAFIRMKLKKPECPNNVNQKAPLRELLAFGHGSENN